MFTSSKYCVHARNDSVLFVYFLLQSYISVRVVASYELILLIYGPKRMDDAGWVVTAGILCNGVVNVLILGDQVQLLATMFVKKTN